MAKYVFSASKNDNTEMIEGQTIVCISTKAFWDKNQYLQDSYEESDIDELLSILEPLNIFELMESTYETDLPVSEVMKELNVTGLFQHDQSLQHFVDTPR